MTDATKVTRRCPKCGGAKELYLDGGLCSCGLPIASPDRRLRALAWEAFGLGVIFGAIVTTLMAIFFDH